MGDAELIMHGVCEGCGQELWLIPLYGPKGGPLRCSFCAGKWNAEHTRRRKWGRIIIKAMKMYQKEGGSWRDLDKLKLASWDLLPGYKGADRIGAEVPDITSELLADALQLTHPDRHPPERRELAERVTQELLALKPFVFPAPEPAEPEPALPPEPESRAVSANDRKPLRLSYPCELCVDAMPLHYCDACKAEWEKRLEQEREKERLKQRERRARRRASRPPATCEVCKTRFKRNRTDARFCSNKCRQRAHRKRVTDKNSARPGHLFSRYGEAAP
jgi:hypothetical protein